MSQSQFVLYLKMRVDEANVILEDRLHHYGGFDFKVRRVDADLKVRNNSSVRN